MSDAINEFEAIKAVHGALAPLDAEARTRVLTYIASLLEIDARVAKGPAAPSEEEFDERTEGEDDDEDVGGASTFSEFADLYAATDPKANGEKALVAAYWLQVCQGAENFTGFLANKELTDLGYRVGNITDAINNMRNRSPSLIVQIKKSGTSRQARKLYKITREGMKRVEEMVGG